MLEQRKLEKLFRQNYSKMIHLLSFLLGIVGVYISVISLMYELRKRKKQNRKN